MTDAADNNEESELVERAALLTLLSSPPLSLSFTRIDHAPAKTVDDLHECVAAYRTASCLAVKNLFLRSKQSGRLVLLVLASDRTVSLNELSITTFGHRKADNFRFASEELLREKLHCKQGALNPFAIRHAAKGDGRVELWVGKELCAATHWLAHPMTNDVSLQIATSDMFKFFEHVGAKVNRL